MAVPKTRPFAGRRKKRAETLPSVRAMYRHICCALRNIAFVLVGFAPERTTLRLRA